jgi:hypothetical protein
VHAGIGKKNGFGGTFRMYNYRGLEAVRAMECAGKADRSSLEIIGGQMDEKSLEMRVAELEDRLAKLQISEEEIKAYQKVSALVGSQSQFGVSPVGAFTCRVVCYCFCHIARAIGINDCTPGAPGGPILGSAGFGTLGT